jgi:hypothetical protein
MLVLVPPDLLLFLLLLLLLQYLLRGRLCSIDSWGLSILQPFFGGYYTIVPNSNQLAIDAREEKGCIDWWNIPHLTTLS